MPRRKRALAKAPDVAGDAMWIKLPIPPELVTVVRKHVSAIADLASSAQALLEGVDRTGLSVRELVERGAAVAGDLEADVKRARRAMDGRRRRRKSSR